VCVDVACGTGINSSILTRAGYVPIGVDLSMPQLQLARNRMTVACADATILPFRDGSIDAAVGTYIHTDVEDFSAVVQEIARCLRPGGRFACVGLHPCFVGPFVDRSCEMDQPALQISAGYTGLGWSYQGSGSGDGLWRRVGGHHKTLALLIGAFLAAGLTIASLQELDGGGILVPRNIGICAEKAGIPA
jgi:SAM-dependent methyltransferase